MSLNEFINKRRKELNMSIDDLVAESGIPKGTLSKITAGINTNPTLSTVETLCKALKCSINDAVGYDSEPDSLSSAELQMIKKYRALDTYGQKAVSAVLNIEYERCSSSEDAVIDTARIAAYGGGTKDIPAANVTKEELEQLEALQRGLNEVAEIEKKLRK